MIEARVAGVPIPESFIASRSSASSMSLPAVSIAPSSDASVKRRGGCVSLRIDSTERVSTSSPCSSFGSIWSPPESSSAGAASTSSPYTAFQPASSRRRPLVRNWCSATIVSMRVRSYTASGWKTARKRFATRSYTFSSSGPIFERSCSALVGISAWWSSTFLSFTTRSSGSLSSDTTYSDARRYCELWPTIWAVGLISAIWSLGRKREFVRGYVIALCSSYSFWAAPRVRRGGERESGVGGGGGGAGAAGGEPEQRVGVALERREVVEQLDPLALLLLVDLRDLAGAPLDLLDDLRRVVLGDALAALVAAAVATRPARLEGGLDEPVRLGLEGADLLLAPGDERERRRLDAAERDRAVERAPQSDRRRAGGVHP